MARKTPSLIIKLSKPARHRGRSVTNLRLSEPTARIMEAADRELNATPLTAYALRRYQITLVARTAGVPRSVVLGITHSELTRAFGWIVALIAPDEPEPKPGETRQRPRKSPAFRLVKARRLRIVGGTAA